MFNDSNDFRHLTVGIVQVGRLQVAAVLVFINDTHGLFHFTLVVEVHLQMHAVAANVVEQWAQLIECHPAGHDALAAGEYLLVQVVPLGTAALRFAHAGCPLDGVQLLDLQQGIEMMHGPYTIQVIQRIVYLLTLLTDEGLHKAAIVIYADHRRDVALQFGHLAGSPRREIAEGHLVALANDVIEFIEYLEIDVVDLLHLVFQHLGLHHRVEQHLVGTLDGCQHVESLHQVGHAHIVVALRLLLTGAQQVLVQQIVGVVGVELDVIRIVWVGMYPDGVFAPFEHTAEDGSQRAWPQLGIGHRQHVGHQRRVGHIPVQIFCPPFRVEPPLVQVAIGLGLRYVGMRCHSLLEMLPHVKHNALVIPPINVSLLGLFKILFPSIHVHVLLYIMRRSVMFFVITLA